jgi:hypothetical protein
MPLQHRKNLHNTVLKCKLKSKAAQASAEERLKEKKKSNLLGRSRILFEEGKNSEAGEGHLLQAGWVQPGFHSCKVRARPGPSSSLHARCSPQGLNPLLQATCVTWHSYTSQPCSQHCALRQHEQLLISCLNKKGLQTKEKNTTPTQMDTVSQACNMHDSLHPCGHCMCEIRGCVVVIQEPCPRAVVQGK